MSRRSASVLLGCALAFISAVPQADAQLNCGAATNENQIFQLMTSNLAVGVDAATRMEDSLCPTTAQVEVWVEGVGGAGVQQNRPVASVYIARPVPYPGTWQSRGKHWVIWYPSLPNEFWNYNGGSESNCNLTSLDPEPCDASTCPEIDPGDPSPIIIDTLGDGYDLSSSEDGVWFDINGDGTLERVAWTRIDSDDAFLALDRNGNGSIDDGSELFGNFTPVYADVPNLKASNGFDALVFAVSHGEGLSDRRVDGNDRIFARLLLWRDTNHNGVSEADELTPFGDTLTAIETDYKPVGRRDAFGNQFRLKALGHYVDGTTGPVYDVWLQMR